MMRLPRTRLQLGWTLAARGTRRLSRLLGVAAVVMSVILAACAPAEEASSPAAQGEPSTGQQPGTSQQRTGEPIRLVYPDWSSEIASAHLFQALLQEELGYRVELSVVQVEEMWAQVAGGEADLMVGAWLPTTHRKYLRSYGEELVDLGAHLTGARIGLVVPTTIPGRRTEDTGRRGRPLVTIERIPQLGERVERFGGRIFGIESGAGVVARTREALEVYGLADRYYLVEGTEQQMINRLAEATHREAWIVVTGWRPHWAFELHNLAFLDDPKNVFGGEESIHTMVRRGFRESFPDAAALLERVRYTPEELERLMLWIREDQEGDPYRKALRWLEVHREQVDRWTNDDE